MDIKIIKCNEFSDLHIIQWEENHFLVLFFSVIETLFRENQFIQGYGKVKLDILVNPRHTGMFCLHGWSVATVLGYSLRLCHLYLLKVIVMKAFRAFLLSD